MRAEGFEGCACASVDAGRGAGSCGRFGPETSASHHRAPQVGRRDLQRLAVLRHRAARHLDALLLQHAAELAVRQRLLRVFGTDQLLDQRAHRGARRVAASLGVERGAEEVLQLEGAVGRGHVLGRGHARDGRLVQAQLVGDLAQHQRLHRDRAVAEEGLLPLDDGLRDTLDGVEALQDVLHEPARLLQPRAQARARFGARAALLLDRLRVEVIDAQLGHHVGIEHDAPAAAGLLHDHVGHDDVGLGLGEGPAGLGLAAHDQRLRGLQQLLVGAGGGHQLLAVAPGQQLEVVLADQDRDHLRLAARPGPQLQRQALRQVARTDAQRLQVVQPLQRAAQAVEQFLDRDVVLVAGQALGDLFQRVGQVAVLVERLDQHHHRAAVLVAQSHAAQLVAQMVLQADPGAAALHGVELVAVVVAGLAGRLTDAVEVLALGAVLPVLALGGAEIGRVHRHGLGVGGHLGPRALPGFVGLALGDRGALHRCVERGRRVFLHFEEGVLLQHLLDFLVKLERGQLQQPDRLLQLRRQRQMLRKTDLQGRLHYILKCSPR
eukprot:Opistho-1_new@53237